ncbi:MAG: glycosyltransferase, partial [Candidatus Methylomirabilales bacterium]
VYAGFDCFMMTSRREGLPNSLLEAMALGLPVVTTDVAGAKELVVDGTTGFVRPQGDVEGLGLALRRLAGDEALRRRLGQAGRQRVVEEFSFTRRMQRIEALYLELAAGAAGTRGT